MRAISLAVTICLLTGCAVQRDLAPREYLDEQTAATITVVQDPWIFTTERALGADDQRGFLHLYAIDVNRMGEHRQYFAVLQSQPWDGSERSAPTLELASETEVLSLSATTEEPRDLGLAEPVAPAYTLGAAWWYFPVDKPTLARIAAADRLGAALVVEGERMAFVPWRDGRDELAELTSVLP